MADKIRIGIEFEVEPDAELRAKGLTTPYRDTVWLTEQDFGGTITAQQLAAIRAGTNQNVNVLKTQRHANWKQQVLNPPPAPEPDPVDPNEAARQAVEAAQAALDAANEALARTTALAEEAVTPEPG